MPDKIGEMIDIYPLEHAHNRIETADGAMMWGRWIHREANRILNANPNRRVEITFEGKKIGLKVDCVAVDVSNVLRRDGTLARWYVAAQPGAKVKEPFYITLPPKMVEEEE